MIGTMRSLKIGVVAMAGLVLSGCANRDGARCPAGLSPMLQVDLYFGRAIPNGGTVSEEAWKRFVDEEITLRFPDGLTITDTTGQWRDRGGIAREPSKHVTIILPSYDAAKLESVRAAYRRRFHQESVLLTEAAACGAF